MLPDEVSVLVRSFALGYPYLAHPDEAENMCGIITCTFAEHAKSRGLLEGIAWARCFKPKDITRPHREGILSNFHTFPVWNDVAIDFTARQFWLEADFPHIELLDTYMRCFTRVELHRVEDIGVPEGGGYNVRLT